MRITRRDQSAFLFPGAHDPSRDPAPRTGVTGRVVDATEIAAGAALTGLLAGRLNHWNIPNTPLPIGLTIGVVLHALDFFNAGPAWSGRHFSNLGNGAIASWATLVGAGYGQQMLAKAGTPPNLAAGVGCPPIARPPTLPQPSINGHSKIPRKPLTEAELAGMSHRHR